MSTMTPTTTATKSHSELRSPSEDPAWLKRAAVASVAGLDLPDGCATAILGSIAEGFGNDASDIDVLVVTPGEDRHSDVRLMTAFEDRRVEVFIRGAESLRRWAAQLPQASGKRAYTEIDLYHRIAYCLPLTDTPAFAQARAAFDTDWLVATYCAYERDHSLHAFARAVLCERLGRATDAGAYAKKALEHAATHFACARGETYRSEKFLLRRLRRAGIDRGSLAAYLELQSSAPEPGLPRFLERVLQLARELGTAVEREPPWQLAVRADVRVLTVGEHLVLSCSGRSAVLHDPRHELADCLAAPLTIDSRAFDRHAAQLGFLHRAGLLEASTPDQRWVDLRHCPPCGSLRVVSNGIVPSSDMVLADVGCARIVECGLSLLGAAFDIENLEEDVIGAIRRGDWDSVHQSLQAIVSAQGVLALCHELVHPVPKSHEYLEALRVNTSTRELARLAEEASGMTIREAVDVPRCYDVIKKMRALIPDGVVSKHFHGCHHSAMKWAKLLRRVFRPWADAVLQADDLAMDLPLKHLVQYSNAAEPAMAAGQDEEMLRWTRDLDLEREVDRLRMQ